MGPYQPCYSRAYVYAPSCAPSVDRSWDAWRRHVRNHMRDPDEEQTMWGTWETQDLEKLIARHKKVNAHRKATEQKKGCVVIVLVADFADAGGKIMHSNTNTLTSLFVRGRHLGCACWMLTQKQCIASLMCLTHVCWMLVWRSRNAKGCVSIIEEKDALVPCELLNELYAIETSETPTLVNQSVS